MRWLRKAIKDPVWFLFTLPFKLIYWLIKLALTHKHLNKDGYVKTDNNQLEHRVIAEEYLGRKLESWEVVHHINGKRSDNRPSNLCVMSWKNHERYHAWYDWIWANYKKYPRRSTQLRKLREDFRGHILTDPISKKKGSA